VLLSLPTQDNFAAADRSFSFLFSCFLSLVPHLRVTIQIEPNIGKEPVLESLAMWSYIVVEDALSIYLAIWESLSKQEKESWLEEASTMHDWFVWCKSKKGAEEIRSFELSGKEIFSNYDETKSKEEKNKKNGRKTKAHRGQSVRYKS